MPETTTTKSRVLLRCKCGVEKMIRVADILAGKTNCCRSCAMRRRMKDAPQDETRQLLDKATAHAAVANRARHYQHCLSIGISTSEWKRLRHVMTNAKTRCANGHPNYGGRGIEFRFDSPSQAVRWAIEHLGLPEKKHSLDRINNDGHYEPGNLRWATRTIQSLNRRAFKLDPESERIRALIKLRPDYSYESIRSFVRRGMTDQKILGRKKYQSTTS